MIKTRQNVFETNSSSTHSISIASGSTADLTDLPYVNDEGIVNISTGEYGWEIETYRDCDDRLSYAATYALRNEDYECKEVEMLEEVIREYTKAEIILFDGCNANTNSESTSFHDHGYIDHQSIDDAAEIFTSKETLAQFLFNPNSYFETDNDNH